MKKKIIGFLVRGCVIYSVLVTVLYLIGYFMAAGGTGNWIPDLKMILVALFISFVLSGAEFVIEKKTNFALRVILHFVICLVSFILVFAFIGGYYNNPSMLLIGIFIFIVLYAVFNVIRFAVIRKKDRSQEESEYTNMFRK